MNFTDPTGMSVDGWIEHKDDDNNTVLTFDPNVKNLQDAINAGYENVIEVYDGLTLYNTTYDYIYYFNHDGRVTDAEDNEVHYYKHINKDGELSARFTTKVGSVIINKDVNAYMNLPPARGSGAITQMDFSSPVFGWA
jgi:hypothetical protein